MQNAASFFAMASPETQLLTIVSEDLQTNCFVTIESISTFFSLFFPSCFVFSTFKVKMAKQLVRTKRKTEKKNNKKVNN